MAQVRALVTLVHNSITFKAGDLFDYPDAMAKQLKGDISEGMELVTKKTTAAFEKVKAEAHAKLVETETVLQHAYEELKGQLDADPSRMGLTQLVLDAENAWKDAQAEVEKSAAELLV